MARIMLNVGAMRGLCGACAGPIIVLVPHPRPSFRRKPESRAAQGDLTVNHWMLNQVQHDEHRKVYESGGCVKHDKSNIPTISAPSVPLR